MITSQYLLEMGLYNKWQNEKLFSLCSELGDEQRKKDRGLFFRSIHQTLDHILKIDEALWFITHEGRPQHIEFQKCTHANFTDLKESRVKFDERLLELASRVSAQWLNGSISFESESLGRSRTIPRALFLIQMFNHQTHHRSQITTELHKMGIDYGNTDMPYNPYLSY